jgi:hypothetical protein
LPLPLIAPNGIIESIVEANDPAERARRFVEATEFLKARKVPTTSITLRIAASTITAPNGVDLLEEFLGFLPLGMEISVQAVSKSNDSGAEQSEVDQVAGSSETLVAPFREDFAVLAEKIRQWMKDPSGPFPINSGVGQASDFHFCKTIVEFSNLAEVDRFWYTERPKLIRLRPATQAEQNQIERDYWQAIGDERRTLLLQERLDSLAARKQAEDESGQMSGTGKPSESTGNVASPPDTSIDEGGSAGGSAGTSPSQ